MIYPHVITSWMKTVEDRKASWERYVFNKTRFEITKGATSSTDGDISRRSASLLIKNTVCPLKKGDAVVMGLSVDEQPPNDAYIVVSVAPISISKKVHHWEVELN